MIHIIEGVDCAGKGTLIDKLHKHTGVPVVKGSSFELAKVSNVDLFQYFVDLTTTSSVIIDRFIYSNMVYASLYKDYSIITRKQAEIIEESILNEAKIYYLYADSDIIKQRLYERGDDYVDANMVDNILNKYEEVLNKSRLSIVRINTGEITPDQVLEKVVGGSG